MGTWKAFTNRGKGLIDILTSEGLSNFQSAIKIGRSPKVVDLYVKQSDSYGKNYKGTTAMALTLKEARKMLRIVLNSAPSTAKIKEIGKL